MGQLMNIAFIILMILAVMILAEILNALYKYQNNTSSDNILKSSGHIKTQIHSTAGMVDSMNALFLETKGSKTVIKFLRFYSLEQRIVIRSILQYENINTYLEASHMGSLYPKFNSGIYDSILYISRNDLEQAKEIYYDYIKTLPKHRIFRKKFIFLKVIFFFFFGVIVAETTVQYRPDLLA